MSAQQFLRKHSQNAWIIFHIIIFYILRTEIAFFHLTQILSAVFTDPFAPLIHIRKIPQKMARIFLFAFIQLLQIRNLCRLPDNQAALHIPLQADGPVSTNQPVWKKCISNFLIIIARDIFFSGTDQRHNPVDILKIVQASALLPDRFQ